MSMTSRNEMRGERKRRRRLVDCFPSLTLRSPSICCDEQRDREERDVPYWAKIASEIDQQSLMQNERGEETKYETRVRQQYRSSKMFSIKKRPRRMTNLSGEDLHTFPLVCLQITEH